LFAEALLHAIVIEEVFLGFSRKRESHYKNQKPDKESCPAVVESVI
jgi:hypothetical protein